VSQYLTARTQIGDIGDAQTAQLVTALVTQLAQFAGPEEPTGSQHAGGISDVAKIPGSLQISHIGCHLR
jgi:type VI protein secretion system component VasF